jgi:hypothetical protein
MKVDMVVYVTLGAPPPGQTYTGSHNHAGDGINEHPGLLDALSIKIGNWKDKVHQRYHA